MGFARTVAKLKAAGEPTRLRILRLLHDSEYSVKDLTEILGQSQPRVSRHVKLLSDAGLIERHQEGSFVFVRSSLAAQSKQLLESIFHPIDEQDDALVRDRLRASHLRERRSAQAQAYFDQNAARWDEIRALHVPEHDVEAGIADLIHAGPYNLVLDLGTGTGRMLELLAHTSSRLVGVDSNRGMLHYARLRLEARGLTHCSVRHGDLYDLPFAEGTADAVVVHQVLHYVENPRAVLAEAARVLRPGGHLLIADFAPHDLEFLRTDHAFVRLGFSKPEISSLFAGTGLEERAYRELKKTDNGQSGLTVALWLACKPAEIAKSNAKARKVAA